MATQSTKIAGNKERDGAAVRDWSFPTTVWGQLAQGEYWTTRIAPAADPGRRGFALGYWLQPSVAKTEPAAPAPDANPAAQPQQMSANMKQAADQQFFSAGPSTTIEEDPQVAALQQSESMRFRSALMAMECYAYLSPRSRGAELKPGGGGVMNAGATQSRGLLDRQLRESLPVAAGAAVLGAAASVLRSPYTDNMQMLLTRSAGPA